MQNFIKKHIRVLLLALVFVCAFAHADDEHSVVLDSIAKTEAFAKAKLEEIKRQNLSVSDVELYHIGDENPVELEALTRMFKLEGISVTYKRISSAELQAMIEDQSKKTAPVLAKVYDVVHYETTGQTDRPKEGFKARLAEIGARIRHMFGVPGGISFLTYKVSRTLREKLVEGGIAIGKAAITSTVLYETLLAKQLAGEDVNVMLPVVVSAAFSIGFDYWQRGNSAFKGQGSNFDFKEGKLVMNRKFYLAVALLHSLIMRESIMAAAHISSGGFSMGWAEFFTAFATSAKGLLGKAPIEMYLERGRRVHSKWWTIGWMTAWGTFYASLQLLDLFHAADFFKNTLTAFGAVGLGFEMYREREAIAMSWNRFKRWVLRQKPAASECETLLLYKDVPQ